MIRINKYLADAGVCSRRAADRLIEEGAVTVDGMVAGTGMRIEESQTVCVHGVPVHREAEDILLLVNKPAGIVCTAEKREPDNIVDFIGLDERIYPIGRLDKASRGLILMTNVGQLHNAITRARFNHEKEYRVVVDRPVDDEFIRQMSSGVYLSELEVTTGPAKVAKIDACTFSIILTEGKNRQIRRMCSELGFEVTDLQRIRIMDLTLDGIEEGSYRRATQDEWKYIRNVTGI